MQRCVTPGLSRSAVCRCLGRHGLPAAPRPEEPPARGTFAAGDFGFVHFDLKHLPRLEGHPSHVFAAMERTTRFVHVEIMPDRSGPTVAACLARFLAAHPRPARIILTDRATEGATGSGPVARGAEFTDRFGDARWRKRTTGTGNHPFDRVRAAHGIEHRLTRPFSPQTNGMVERFNRRLAEAIRQQPNAATNAGKNKFETHAERDRFIAAFVAACNRTRLRCLANKAPLKALNNQTKHNTMAGTTWQVR